MDPYSEIVALRARLAQLEQQLNRRSENDVTEAQSAPPKTLGAAVEARLAEHKDDDSTRRREWYGRGFESNARYENALRLRAASDDGRRAVEEAYGGDTALAMYEAARKAAIELGTFKPEEASK